MGAGIVEFLDVTVFIIQNDMNYAFWKSKGIIHLIWVGHHTDFKFYCNIL